MQAQIERSGTGQRTFRTSRARAVFHPNRIKRILVPIDFSRVSLNAIPNALSLARQFRADVHLLHVVDTTQYLSPALLSLAMTVRADWNERLLKCLRGIALRYGPHGEIHVLHPREGAVYQEICAAARETRSELIVIATHGYTGYQRVLLGSTAERTVQHSPCPVLVVRHPARVSSGRNGRSTSKQFVLNKILVPTDFSDCAKTAFNYAVELANEFDAELCLIHVINPNAYPFGDEFAALHAARLIRESSQLARRRMREMLAKTKLRYSTRVGHGLPAAEICAAANSNVDLIVSSTHGRTGIGHVLIGSVAEHVVRHARCPVLVIPVHRSSTDQLNRN